MANKDNNERIQNAIVLARLLHAELTEIYYGNSDTNPPMMLTKELETTLEAVSAVEDHCAQIENLLKAEENGEFEEDEVVQEVHRDMEAKLSSKENGEFEDGPAEFNYRG